MKDKKIIFINPKKRKSVLSKEDKHELDAATINTFLYLQRLSRMDLVTSAKNKFKGFAKGRPKFW